MKIKEILKERKKGGKLFVANLTGNIFILALNFLLPFFISNNEYKHFVVVFSLFNSFCALYTFGYQGLITRELTHTKKINSVISVFFFSWLFCSIILTLLLIGLNYFFNLTLYFEIDFTSWILILFASSIIGVFRIFLYFLISLEIFSSYNFFFVSNKFLQFFLITIFALFSYDIINAILLTSLITFIMIGYFVNKNYKIYYDLTIKSKINSHVQNSWPLSINTFAGLGSGYGYNAIIAASLSPIYTIILNYIFQLQNIGVLINNSLMDSKIKSYYSLFSSEKKNKILFFFKDVLYNAIIVFFIMFLPFVALLFYANHLDIYISYYVLIIFGLGIFINYLKPFGSNLLIFKNSLKSILFISMFYNIINLGLFYNLIKVNLNNILIVQGSAFIVQIILLTYFGYYKFNKT